MTSHASRQYTFDVNEMSWSGNHKLSNSPSNGRPLAPEDSEEHFKLPPKHQVFKIGNGLLKNTLKLLCRILPPPSRLSSNLVPRPSLLFLPCRRGERPCLNFLPFPFPFSLPFYSPYLLLFMSFLSAVKSLVLIADKA